jgi:DNA repair exonuclease SbcCD ATPase subunit
MVCVGLLPFFRYFTCTDLHGLFAPLPKVEKIEETITPKVDNNSPNVVKRLSGRGLSGSPGSSVSSLSSLGRVRQMQQVEPEPLTPVRVEPLESETLSHIMFEKDHQIATLRSTVEQGEMDKAKLAEEITELRRKVDDLQFQLVEQSVISGDTLEQVSLKDQTQLSQALQQVNEEKQRNELMTRELDTCLKNIEQLEREKQELNDRLVQNAGSVGSTLLQERELEIKKLLIEKEQLLLEKTKAESALKLAENDFKSTEIAAGGLQSELDTVKQQLQETLDVCGQQEALLEEKVNELETLEENSRSVARDLEALKMENMNLSETTNKLITERNAAIAQCDRLMAETSSSSNEQSQLAVQCRELLEERDQLRNSLQETTILLEKVNGERDDALYNLAEVKSLGAEADDKSKEMLIKYDSSQKEVTNDCSIRT